MLKNIRSQLTILYAIGILISVFALLTLFYLSTEIVFYRQVDDTLKTHLVALSDSVAKNAEEAGCNCISKESEFLQGILQIPGMPTAILDIDHQPLKTSVDWTTPQRPLTEFIPGSYFNDKLATLSYRFLMLPVKSQNNYLGFVVMGHPIDAFLKTRTTLAWVMVILFLALIIPAIVIARILTEKALAKEKQFIGDMAHSLKTPLAVLQSQLESSSSPDKAKLLTNVKRISQTVSETLETAYTESSLGNKTVDLPDLVEELIEITQHLGKEKKITIKNHLSGGPIIVPGTRQKLAKAILAILENALQYSYKSGQITIHLVNEDNKAILTISDNGKGINQDELPFVFERTYRGRLNNVKGHGLGLSIAKNIIEEIGGVISLSSQPNKGTTVIITLPVSHPVS